jgi:hypothetical protein
MRCVYYYVAFKEYHQVWLKKHPERSPEWLSDMLSEGFHVHRVDGDNKDPENLILIEAVDHMLLHGHDIGWGRRRHAKDPPRQISDRARYERAKKALKKARGVQLHWQGVNVVY